VNGNVFLTSPWVPPEWVKAHGLEPRGIWAQPALREMAPAAGVCAYAETVLRHAEEQADSAFVFTTHCDQLRRAFDALSGGAPGQVFLFNLPATSGTPAAGGLFHDELNRLSHWLVSVGGRRPEPGALGRLAGEYQRARRRLIAAADGCPARQYAEAVLRFHWEGRVELPSAAEPQAATRREGLVRLGLVGGPFTAQHWALLDEMERAGGSVVLNGTEAGERSLGAGEPDGGEDLAASLTPEQLSGLFLSQIVDVFQRPNDRLYEWLRQRVRARRVEALVLWHYFGCDLWRAELQTLRETLRLPVLMLEADETGGGFPRNRTRLQAFLEALAPA